MRGDREAATILRRAGKSYDEIYRALKIPKATLSNWFAGIDWSAAIKKQLVQRSIAVSTQRMLVLDAIRGSHLRKVYQAAREEARKEFDQLKYNPLFIAGIMLYWGEGDKRTRHTTKLTNTDPEMIRLFVSFLRNACFVPKEKIRASLVIYPDLDSDECVVYWSRQSSIPCRNFVKSSVIVGRHPERRLGRGICLVYISSTYFKVKMLEWMSLLPQELMRKGYYANM